MADFKQAVHRPGPFKQQNKPHKHGRHRSKGALDTLAKGRVSVKISSNKKLKQQTKADHKNHLKQLRAKKRNDILHSKRCLGTDNSPPHLVVVLSTSMSLGCQDVLFSLSAACRMELPTFVRCSSVVFPLTNKRFTFYCPPAGDLDAILNVCKIADTILFLYDTSGGMSSFAKLVLDSCFAQGLPSTFHVIQGLSSVAVKKQSEVKKRVQTLVSKSFPKEKLYRLDTQQDAANVLRFIGEHKHNSVFVRDIRPHLLVENWDFMEDETIKGNDEGVLKVSGYIRGRPLSVNQLVHLTGFGTYQLLKIEAPPDPCPMRGRIVPANDLMDMEDSTAVMDDSEVKLLAEPDATQQESLLSEIIPDPMEGEQTWPLEEELIEASMAAARRQVKKAVPCGTSDYQSSWILPDEEEEEGKSEGEEYEEDDECPVDALSDTTESMVHTDMDTESVTAPLDADCYDAHMNMNEEQKQLELIQAEKLHNMFPDEVDTPCDIPAKERFAKYRGLKSFRKSPWDPKENLPLNYARIFQFSNFKRTRKQVLSTKDDQGIEVGLYVTLYIKGVAKGVVSYLQLRDTPLIVYGLLPNENKMSIVNIVLKRTPNYTQPIKSKDELIFYCGVRKFTAGPVFSQHTLADKHKYERFLPKEGVTVATVYAPIAYSPTKVLVFKPLEDGSHVLVATGSVLDVNPNRIVCKKIVLSGHPFKIFKRSAVIRYMFFNRDDILWFKPVELKTKLGLRGHIKEPLGTHGHMKCVFDKPLKAHDTALMCLYKRIFPRWSYSSEVPLPTYWVTEEEEEENI